MLPLIYWLNSFCCSSVCNELFCQGTEMTHIWPTAHHVLSAEQFSGSQSLAKPWQEVRVPQAQGFAAVIAGFYKDLVMSPL